MLDAFGPRRIRPLRLERHARGVPVTELEGDDASPIKKHSHAQKTVGSDATNNGRSGLAIHWLAVIARLMSFAGSPRECCVEVAGEVL